MKEQRIQFIGERSAMKVACSVRREAHGKGQQCTSPGAYPTVPKSRGGGDRVTNLTLACESCNLKKGNQTAQEFGFPHVQARARQPLKDAAAVNSTRWLLYERLKATGLPIETGTGGRTKWNRKQRGI